VLFGLLSTMHPATADLFFAMVRHGAAALDGVPAAQQEAARIDIAAAFRGVFLTVACFSVTIVACAATLPLRRL
jgi:hypothetical protein